MLLRTRNVLNCIFFSKIETKHDGKQVRDRYLVFPGNLSVTLNMHFPSQSLFLFTIRFSRRPSGSETAVSRRDLFEWFSSQSGSLVKFLLAPPFSLPFSPFFSISSASSSSSSSPAFSRPIRIHLTDLSSKADSHGRSDSLCTFQKCSRAAPGMNETRR